VIHSISPATLELLSYLAAFSFAYPMAMAWLWMFGAIAFHLDREAGEKTPRQGLVVCSRKAQHFGLALPRVSVMLPCFNEAEQVEEVVRALMKLNYPNYEVLAINDGSTDRTGAILDQLSHEFPLLRVIHQASNQGKAVALNTAAALASGSVLVGIDGDAILDREALAWMVRHFIANPTLAAVTGNPRIRTRSTVLGRLQVAEFSSIIGLIKRAQYAIFGHLFTVSGVITAFSREAILKVGGWSDDMLTEDIDISWKLQTQGWAVRFEPRALVWILMPETLRGLWKQRLRWAMGGVQVIRKYRWVLAKPELHNLWPVFAEYCLSICWAYCMTVTLLFTVGLHAFGQEAMDYALLSQRFPVFGWAGMGMAVTCMVQFALSMAMDRRYDVRLLRHMSVTIWYPIAFWMLIMLTAIVALPSVLFRAEGRRATWVSPDRGLTGTAVATAVQVGPGHSRRGGSR
jgi:poly-beta-1,6-N-acetyl-D-glucosamine synthase